MTTHRVALFQSAATPITTRDYTSHDAYLDLTPIHFWDGEGAERRTETIPLQPPQTDVRFNPNEMPSALGRHFAQGDFCVDEDTEILTQRGWARYDQLQVGDLTLGHTEEGSRWVPVTAVNVFDAKPRKMLHLKSQLHDSLTTSEHRWLVRRAEKRGGTLVWKTSETLTASDRIPVTAVRLDIPEQAKWTDAVVEVVAWYYTEGWHRYYGRKEAGKFTGVAIAQNERVNPVKTQRLRQALATAFPEGPIWEKRRKDDLVTFCLGVELGRFLESLAPDKVPSPDFLMSLTQAQLELFIAVSIMADGTTQTCPRFGSETRIFVQHDKRRTDVLEMVCALAGVPTHTRPKKVHVPGYENNESWSTTLLGRTHVNPMTQSKRPTGRSSTEWIKHDGLVWCPTTETGTWLARRNGAVFFTGNSHGAGQPYFHYQSSDQAKYLYSEGFDISEPGLLTHLPAVLTAHGGALTRGRSAQSQGKLFVGAGNSVRIYDPITGNSTTEDPHDGDSAGPVYDITAEGDLVFAALGANGIHVRSADGVWSHHSDAQAILVSHLKDRLIAASARNFYEITAGGAAPSPKLTLKEGWTFTDLGENGPYIYAPAINETAGLSKVHHFGLDGSLNVIVQGSTWMPNNELCYSFKGYLGIVFLGCGRVNADGGKDALLYKAEPDGDGFLPLQNVQESEGAGTRDLSVKAMATQGRNILLGWSLGEDSPFGVREGLARYDPALNAFSNHLSSSTDTATPEHVLSCGVFEGRIYFVTIDGVYYEDTTKKVAQAFLISSLATFQNAGLKKWDESEVATKQLPATSSVDLQYSLTSPEDAIFSLAGSHTTTGETTARFRHPNTEGSRLAVKLVSNATASQALAPEIESFSVRVNPTVEDTEYRLIRTVHLIGTIGKGMRGQVKNYNPRTERDNLRAEMYDFFDWHEADASYNVRLSQMSEIKTVTNYSSTNGDPRKEEYICILVMEGRET